MGKILKAIKNIQKQYKNEMIDAQSVISKLASMQNLCMKYHMNMYNYLYRNGIFNRKTALNNIQHNLNKFKKFPHQQKQFKHELQIVKASKNNWFENYGVHNGYHDLIKSDLDNWKVSGLLNSLICDLYVGTANEGSTKDLMER